MKVVPALLLLFYLGMLNNCQESGNYQNQYNARVILIELLNQMQANSPSQVCLTLQDSKAACLSQSLNPPVATTEASLSEYYAVQIDPTAKVSSYSSYCQLLLQSSDFSNYTDQAKICALNCQNTYWKSQNSCSSETFATLWNNLSKDSSYQGCISNCFSLTNNNVNSISQDQLLVYLWFLIAQK